MQCGWKAANSKYWDQIPRLFKGKLKAHKFKMIKDIKGGLKTQLKIL